MLLADNLYRSNPQAFLRAFTEGDVKRLQEYQSLSLLRLKQEPHASIPSGRGPRRVSAKAEEAGRKKATGISTDRIVMAFDATFDIAGMELSVPWDNPRPPMDRSPLSRCDPISKPCTRIGTPHSGRTKPTHGMPRWNC